jgi:hypothetical protein
MVPNSENKFSKYALMSLIIFLIGLVILIVLSPTISGSLEPVSTEIPIPPTQTSGEDLRSVDDILNNAMSASIAFNAPQAMKLDETVIVEMSINPSITEAEIVKQIEAEGEIQTGTLLVTPLTKAVLIAQNGQAFEIQVLHDSDIQPITTNESTRWQWQVTAKKGGAQALTLVVYRLIKFEDQEFWRQVETYKADINVDVTFQQRLSAFDWKWLVGLIITSLIIPLIMRWLDHRKPAAKSNKKRSN